MIVSIKHKGLLKFYESGNGSRLPAEHLRKINRIFDQLEAVSTENDIKQMGLGVHKLSGNMSDLWALKISPNFRLVFRFDDGDIFDLDYIDYH